jgi:hypothetical protein
MLEYELSELYFPHTIFRVKDGSNLLLQNLLTTTYYMGSQHGSQPKIILCCPCFLFTACDIDYVAAGNGNDCSYGRTGDYDDIMVTEMITMISSHDSILKSASQSTHIHSI